MLESDDRADRRRSRRSRRRSATATAGSRSTSTRTRTRSRRRSSTPGSAVATTSPWSATRTRRSTRSPGATSDYLIGFGTRFPGARDGPARDELPLDAGGARAGQPGPRRRPDGGRRARARGRPRPPKRLRPESARQDRAPEIGGFPTEEAELAGITAAIRALARAGHGRTASMAVLVRTNAQLPADRGRARARPGSRSTSAASGSSRGPRSVARSAWPRRSRGSRATTPLADRLAAAFERELGVRRDIVPRRRGRRRTARRGRHAPRARRGPRPFGPARADVARVPRRGRAADGGRGRRRGGRRRAAHLPPCQGPRVGRGLPPGAGGRNAPDPPGEGARGARRGATSAVRRDHPGAALPVAVVGRPGGPGRASARASSTDSCRRSPGGSRGGRHRKVRLAAPKVAPGDRSPLSNALRAWRTARAKADAVAPFIVFHDTTIEAIASQPPAVDRRAPPRPGRRADQARSLRRGDHRRRRSATAE